MYNQGFYIAAEDKSNKRIFKHIIKDGCFVKQLTSVNDNDECNNNNDICVMISNIPYIEENETTENENQNTENMDHHNNNYSKQTQEQPLHHHPTPTQTAPKSQQTQPKITVENVYDSMEKENLIPNNNTNNTQQNITQNKSDFKMFEVSNKIVFPENIQKDENEGQNNNIKPDFFQRTNSLRSQQGGQGQGQGQGRMTPEIQSPRGNTPSHTFYNEQRGDRSYSHTQTQNMLQTETPQNNESSQPQIMKTLMEILKNNGIKYDDEKESGIHNMITYKLEFDQALYYEIDLYSQLEVWASDSHVSLCFWVSFSNLERGWLPFFLLSFCLFCGFLFVFVWFRFVFSKY